MARAPDVQVVARPIPLDLTAPRSNAALELADSLTGLNQELTPLLGKYAANRQAKLSAQAQADAMANSGKAFGDAVREGKLRPTQNPWYVQAYEEKAAQVRAQGQVSALASEAETWAERSDPAAFAAKWTQHIGELAKGYAGIDQATGFNASAAPLTQQVLNSNVEYNVQRIQAENVQNIGTLATTAILGAVSANGGKPSAAQVYEALEPQRRDWLATGGSEAEWNTLATNAVIGAAFNTGDASLLDVLDDSRGGKGALSNIAGPNGQPMAETIAGARYRIEEDVSSKGMAEIRAKQNAVKLEGMKAEQAVWDRFGFGLQEAKVSKADLLGFLKEQGYTPQAAQYALGEFAKAASENNSLTRSLMGADPEVLDLYAAANRHGYSSRLQAKIADKVRLGEMDLTEAEQILGTATARTNHLESEARSDARQARSDARAAAREENALTTATAKALQTYRTQLAGAVAMKLERAKIRVLRDPKARRQFEQSLEDAESEHLMTHPGDVAGARAVVNARAYDFMQAAKPRLPRTPTQPATAGRQ